MRHGRHLGGNPRTASASRHPQKSARAAARHSHREERSMRKLFPALALVSMVALGAAQPAGADPPFYKQRNLISDDTTLIPAEHRDGLLLNAWGLAASATSPWWIANNGSDSSILFNVTTGAIQSLVVAIPDGAPTGLVFNNSGGGFVVTSGASSAPAVFIFSSEAGVISGWNPNVPPPVPSTQAQVGATVADAIYKGLAIAGTGSDARLYATNFHAGTVDVFDNTYTLLSLPGAFVDPNLPVGYAPFGIQNINGTLYVTYALQDDDAEDDVAGPGNGFVDAYDTSGKLLRRVASRGSLNSPWGLALAPADFGAFSNKLLVGNFGDGRINAYDLSASTSTGEAVAVGPLHSAKGPPVEIEGLWALQFGNGAGAGPKNTLFFTSGPFDEKHGLFGSLEPTGPPGHNK
jgi:uncharacterized protein (TIGR03118 family)